MTVYPSAPVVGVGAVVWRDEHILLIRRGTPPRQGAWSLPGGHQELGETVYAAAEREIREETGVEIRILDIAAVVDLIHSDEEGRIVWHYTVIDVVADWVAGEARAGDDAAEVAWVELSELPRYQPTEAVMEVVAAARRKRRDHAPST